MRLFYSLFLKFVEGGSDTPDNYNEFVTTIKSNNLGENPDELRSILHIIHKVSFHHKRQPNFISKVHKTILFFSDQIKESFSNSDLYRIFRSNKLLLIFLFEQKIITVDEDIIYRLYEKYKKEDSNYFYTEFKPFLNHKSERGEIILVSTSKVHDSNFERNRHEGENDSPISQLIREDSINEFLSYVREKKVSLSSIVPKSFFETNSLLKKKVTSLIEYAAFFGSIHIFQYLLKSNVNFTSSIWNYAIHGSNLDVIHLLEKHEIKPEHQSFRSCFYESVKCHHNELAHYIKMNLYTNNEDETDGNFFMNFSKFYNFNFFINDLKDNYEAIFSFACKYDYMTIVKILLEKRKINLKESLLMKVLIFFYDEIFF